MNQPAHGQRQTACWGQQARQPTTSHLNVRLTTAHRPTLHRTRSHCRSVGWPGSPRAGRCGTAACCSGVWALALVGQRTAKVHQHRQARGSNEHCMPTCKCCCSSSTSSRNNFNAVRQEQPRRTHHQQHLPCRLGTQREQLQNELGGEVHQIQNVALVGVSAIRIVKQVRLHRQGHTQFKNRAQHQQHSRAGKQETQGCSRPC